MYSAEEPDTAEPHSSHSLGSKVHMEDSVHCRVIARYTRMTHGGRRTPQDDSRYTWRTAYTILQDDSKVHTWSSGSLVPRRPGNEARSSGGQCTLQEDHNMYTWRTSYMAYIR